MAKRPCSSSSSDPNHHRHHYHRLLVNPRVSPSDAMSSLLEAFLGLPDASPISVDLSFQRLLQSKASEADQSLLIDRALDLGSSLLEAGKRAARKRAANHNSVAWALPPDLTSRVFSMLDMQSLCYTAATCSMFNKCAMDPLCYSNIDLTTVVPKVNNGVVSTMIHRAGNVLQSLKLGVIPGSNMSHSSQPLVCNARSSVDTSGFSWIDKRKRQGKESSILTRNCLTSLSENNGASGALLRRLHLYNIERLENSALCTALSSCPSLIDLELVGLHVELRQTLMSVSANCPLIERLFVESSKQGRDDSLKSPTCIELVSRCPHITSLALRGFKLQDSKARILVKGFRELKYVDFSTSDSVNGTFLRNLGSSTSGSLLEVLILRDCIHLKEVEVARFLTTVLAGEFKSLRYLDISNREGLASEGDWYDRCYNSSIIPLKQMSEERPDICLLAEFPSEGSFIEIERMIDSDINSEISLTSQLSSHSSDSSMFMSTSESSYSSDRGSGSDDGRYSGFIDEESSDELEFPAA